jgi:hypothetical protein
MSPASNTIPSLSTESEVRRAIASATLKLHRYRLARDRVRMERLMAEPQLFQLIAGVFKPQA